MGARLTEEVLHAKAREVWEIYGKIDILMNNAAYIDVGIFEETKQAVNWRHALESENNIGFIKASSSDLPYVNSAQLY